MFVSFVVLLCILSIVWEAAALKDLPERARSGKAYLQYAEEHKNLKASLPKYWTSRVDNFDSNNNATFSQKYFVDNTYWDGKGPIFFEIGGEGTLSPPGGYLATLSKQYNALLVALEHRFYGNSIPNGNSFTENLKFLNVEQALADLANFTKWFSESYQTNGAPWFAFGGSYPGALSSWYRIAYPDMTVGSLSSSGVTNCIINFYQFDQQVTAAIGNACADQIKRIQSAFERKISTPEGWKAALDMFYCESDMWKEDFFYMIADSWSMADQYSAKSQLCGAILNDSITDSSSDEDIMKAFADFSNSFWGKDFCAGGFYNSEALADPKRWDVNSRSWRWQTCDQVSYFNTAPAQGSLRASSVNMDYHLKQCRYIFNQPHMYPRSVEINKKFGAEEPYAHKVFYSDFSDDPWQRASVTYPVSSDQPYFLTQCNDCGHCMDFHAPKPTDPENLTKSRTEFERYLKKWLSEAQK